VPVEQLQSILDTLAKQDTLAPAPPADFPPDMPIAPPAGIRPGRGRGKG
jgi:hypothetical protein